MLHFPSPDIGMFGRRQRHARGHRIPVTIGGRAGTKSRDVTVVVDNYGADDVAPLAGGCSCCTVRVELQAALRRLSAEREKGGYFSRVLIETTNDIGPILRTFATERALAGEFYVEDAPDLSGDGILRFGLIEDAPLSWDAFSRFISTLITLRGADLLRVKGLLNIQGCRGPVVVQCMQHLALPPVELQAWPDEDRTSRLEFVTRGIEEKMVQSLFDSIRSLQTSS